MKKSFLNEIISENSDRKVSEGFSNFLQGSQKAKSLHETLSEESLGKELALFIEGNNTVNEQVPAVKRTLVKHYKKAEYNTELAERAWMRVVSEAAKQYATEHGRDPRLWETMFPIDVRQSIVEEFERNFYTDLERGKVNMEELFNE
jgi:hypothetical protein